MKKYSHAIVFLLAFQLVQSPSWSSASYCENSHVTPPTPPYTPEDEEEEEEEECDPNKKCGCDDTGGGSSSGSIIYSPSYDYLHTGYDYLYQSPLDSGSGCKSCLNDTGAFQRQAFLPRVSV